MRRLSALITNFFYLLKIIRKKRPDIIVGYSMTNGLFGLFFSKILRIPYIFHYIDILHKLVPFEYIQKFAQYIARISFKLADLILIYTELQKKYVVSEGAPQKKVKILPNGISLQNTKVNDEKLRKLKEEYSISNDDFVIFYMGYLYEFAGLQKIIKFYNESVLKGKYKLKFLILGDGGIYNSLKKLIRKINANWVILPGRVHYFDITEYIQLADLCLMSFEINEITKEITPIKIIEYMAMKKPVLSSSLPGAMLEFGNDNGVIFVKNQRELIKKIESFIPKKEKLKVIGLKGLELVKKKYLWSIVINKFKSYALDLIRKKSNKHK
ncbi:hypothetical protein LCGC14_1662870 [marine sediment metagenome]|uniref:Glycosyltransferase subfamily 4-like N-terminal domain-containing protein n=1 Tax=marine sediment metagenome TaxID=412755 RepID=A0A0F9K9D8_9ZZZZ